MIMTPIRTLRLMIRDEKHFLIFIFSLLIQLTVYTWERKTSRIASHGMKNNVCCVEVVSRVIGNPDKPPAIVFMCFGKMLVFKV